MNATKKSTLLPLNLFTCDGDSLLVDESDLASQVEGHMAWMVQLPRTPNQRGPNHHGIQIKSHKTGRVVPFKLKKVIRTDGPDREMTGWEFVALETDQPIKRVVVFND